MENGREKQLIYVKDLVFRALYSWKVILVAALVFAVLLGAFAVLKNGQEVDLGGLNMTPETQGKVDQLKNRTERYERLAEMQREYIETSAFMAIDPYAAYVCGFHLYPEPTYDAPNEFTPVEQDTIVLARAYQSLITDADTFEGLARQFDYTVRDLREMLVFDVSIEGILGVCIYGQSVEQAQKMMDVVQTVVLEGQDAIAQGVHSHNLKLIPYHKGPAYDKSVMDTQNEAYKLLAGYEDTLLTAKSELQRYLPTQLTAESGNPLLYAIIGAVLGAFLVVCVVWVLHLSSDKIYSARVLENRTGVRVLGCTDSGKKRFFLDRWLRKLEGRSGSEEAALAVDIRNRCQESKTVLIMGNFCGEALSGMIAALEKTGICCKVCSTKAQALEALPGCDGVLLAETCDVSRYAQVEWAMQTVADYQKNLIGCVLIDG